MAAHEAGDVSDARFARDRARLLENLRATWEVDLGYTQFGGAGRWNDLNDRDFIAATVKYSF